jgi:hypothetical protein
MTFYGVRDKGNHLIWWFNTKNEAEKYIKERDPKGSEGYHVVKSK